METPLTQEQLKAIIKSAVVEALEDKCDLLRGIVEETLEDAALAHAMEEAETEGLMDRAEVFQILERPAWRLISARDLGG